MSGSTTRHMISAYTQMAAPTMFLSGLFQSPPENFHESEEVEVDIMRSDEDISIVVQDLSTGARMNSEDIFTNKAFKPPTHDEEFPINSFDLIKREVGQDPFQSPVFRGNLITRAFRAMAKIEAKIRRSIELQASQVLQTGIVTLIDSNGVALYTLDYKPKVSHFPTAGTAWNAGGADIIGDLVSLCNVIRSDGLDDPDQIIMGEASFEAAMQDTTFRDRFDARRADLGTISPMQMRGGGGIFRGVVEVGNYKLDIWTYGGRYKDPQTGVKTKFIDDGKVVVRASSGRLDLTFGAIPNIGRLLGQTGPSMLPEMPGRLANAAGGMDLFTNSYLSPDGKQFFGGVGARPLCIPTAIDTYGCIATGV